MTQAVQTAQYGSSNVALAFKNRLINGDCRVDQRNEGASVTITTNGQMSLDRFISYVSVGSKFSVQRNAGSVTPPAGFTNYIGCTSLAATTVSSGDFYTIGQNIEGYNLADLGWGAAGAKTITLSFWVRSSLTGTFGGALRNQASDRSYPFSYTISAANTWEQKSITVPGDTTGTWIKDSGNGCYVFFSLGTGSTFSGTANAWVGGTGLVSVTGATNVVSTNGATFYLTGIQFEVGSQATSFDYLSLQTQLSLCERYFEKSFNYGTAPNHNVGPALFLPHSGSAGCGGNTYLTVLFRTRKRVDPGFRFFDPSGAGTAFATNAARFFTACNAGYQTTAFGMVGAEVGLSGYVQGGTAATVMFNWTADAEIG